MPDSGGVDDGGESGEEPGAAPSRDARSEPREYQYSVIRYTPKATMHDEEVNIGIILADRAAGRIHRRLITEADIKRRNAEGLLPCPAMYALGAAACGDKSGDPVGALNRLHARYGRGRDVLCVTEPRYLHLPTHDHEGAAEWMYESTLSRARELSEGVKKVSMSGAEHPNAGEYWFASIQYVPDLIRDEAVNVGLALADKTTGRTIVRYAQGADREDLGRGRFEGLGHLHPYEREAGVDDIDAYMRGIAKPDMSCLQCTVPRTASGRRPGQLVERLYARLVAPAPHHDGGRFPPPPSPLPQAQAGAVTGAA